MSARSASRYEPSSAHCQNISSKTTGPPSKGSGSNGAEVAVSLALARWLVASFWAGVFMPTQLLSPKQRAALDAFPEVVSDEDRDRFFRLSDSDRRFVGRFGDGVACHRFLHRYGFEG